ncbi:MAG: RNA-binding protein [Phaeodactylibacter sp.]|nr:RNA-binding protein [Phaeodactylibacter sp.]MCB9294517.1 RNA-binding protein [Lewinellaceae bacterium]
MNIFVARLNFDTDSDTLREVFESFGAVDSAKVIMDHFTGKSRGFGFVEMPNDDEAYAAIEQLNDSDLDGNTIVVKKAEPRGGNRRQGGGNFNRREGGGSGGSSYGRRDSYGGGGGRDNYNRRDSYGGGGGRDNYNRRDSRDSRDNYNRRDRRDSYNDGNYNSDRY